MILVPQTDSEPLGDPIYVSEVIYNTLVIFFVLLPFLLTHPRILNGAPSLLGLEVPPLTVCLLPLIDFLTFVFFFDLSFFYL